jgi:hypothetical protein
MIPADIRLIIVLFVILGQKQLMQIVHITYYISSQIVCFHSTFSGLQIASTFCVLCINIVPFKFSHFAAMTGSAS